MIKIIKKIFKAGNYGKKGNYSIEKLKEWAKEGKEFSIVAGHVGDWIKSGYAKTSIPVGGKAKCVSVDEEGYLCAEIQYNEFGKKAVKSGAYENFSIGISTTGKPDHLAILGYVPPHIDSLDKAFSEFAGAIEEEVNEYIEFEETPEGISLEEIVKYLENLDVSTVDQKIFGKLQEILFTKQDQAFWVERLKKEGYEVVKAEFSQPKTEEELRAEIRLEFARENEKEGLKSKILSLVPPSLKPLMEFSVEEAFKRENYENLIEFSEGESATMREHLEKLTADGGPFKHLFTEFNKSLEGEGKEKPKTASEIVENAKRIMKEVG